MQSALESLKELPDESLSLHEPGYADIDCNGNCMASRISPIALHMGTRTKSSTKMGVRDYPFIHIGLDQAP